MNIYLTRSQASTLGWTKENEIVTDSDVRNNKLIRACFYLGYSTIFISEIVHNPMRKGEAECIMDVACSLGMGNADTVVVIN